MLLTAKNMWKDIKEYEINAGGIIEDNEALRVQIPGL
jgi:hypothetical protein